MMHEDEMSKAVLITPNLVRYEEWHDICKNRDDRLYLLKSKLASFKSMIPILPKIKDPKEKDIKKK